VFKFRNLEEAYTQSSYQNLSENHSELH
jgi:hypothetical protein